MKIRGTDKFEDRVWSECIVRVSKTGVADFSPQQHIHKNEEQMGIFASGGTPSG